MVGATKGSVVLDVQLAYKPTVTATKAFKTFTEAIQRPIQSSRVQRFLGDVLSIRTEKVIILLKKGAKNRNILINRQ